MKLFKLLNPYIFSVIKTIEWSKICLTITLIINKNGESSLYLEMVTSYSTD